GVEVMRYGLQALLLQFAERTNIPIASSVLSKTVIDERHPLHLGVYQGGVGKEGVRDYVEGSDCVIFLGMFMTDINLGIFTARLTQQLSIFSTSEKTSISYHTYNSVYLTSFLQGLLNSNIRCREVLEEQIKICHSEKKSITSELKEGAKEFKEFGVESGKRITIGRVLQFLESIIDDKTFVIADTGDALFGSTDITIPNATKYMASGYYASMGFAIPAIIGVQVAHPEVRPLVLVGDGAFQMTGMELSTAVRYNLNPIVLVLNNYGYGTERPMLDGTFNDVQLWQYSRIPQIFNAGKGSVIFTEGDFVTGMKQAFSDPQNFYLLDIHLDPKDISPALQRFTRALGKRVQNQ
ncbi:MAG: alpha-keto acid decarboxylase family protein, partial [Oligoflexia bacterium]|nr:alpha-keto acid decarboxylase family protein [Oligoflexia bacterium]